MVGLVVVSHSPALARAAVDLALEMVPGEPPPIAIAAGLTGGEIGTDAAAVQAAIEQVDDGVGVVVLMDLGSAVLSSEMALELLDPELRQRVHLTAAPIVEGLIAAVVQAAAGESPGTIMREATAGLGGKEAHLGITPTPAEDPTAAAAGEERAVFTVTIEHGLHARPAARVAATASRFNATVQLRNTTTGTGYVPAASLSRVAALAARQGHQLEVAASGPQAREAVAVIVALAGSDFGDKPTSVAPAAVAAHGPMAASPGIGIGPKWTIGGGDIAVPETTTVTDAAEEWRALQAALAATRDDIAGTRDRMLRNRDEQNAAIFDAHLMLLADAEILDDVRHRIEDGAAGGAAWHATLSRVEADWAESDNTYLNARATDVRGVRNQVLSRLLGKERHITSQPGILVAADLTPNDIALLDTGVVTGIVTAAGSPTSHTAILARALGIPAVVAAGDDVLALPDGTDLVIDGSDGTLLVMPPAETARIYRARAEEAAGAEAAARSRANSRHSPVTGSSSKSLPTSGRSGTRRSPLPQAPTRLGCCAPNSCSWAAPSHPRRKSRKPITGISPSGWRDANSPSVPSTSAATNPSTICRCLPKPTRSSGYVASG